MLSDARFFDVGKVIVVSAIKYSVFSSEGLIKLKSGAENYGIPWKLLGILILPCVRKDNTLCLGLDLRPHPA